MFAVDLSGIERNDVFEVTRILIMPALANYDDTQSSDKENNRYNGRFKEVLRLIVAINDKMSNL